MYRSRSLPPGGIRDDACIGICSAATWASGCEIYMLSVDSTNTTKARDMRIMILLLGRSTQAF